MNTWEDSYVIKEIQSCKIHHWMARIKKADRNKHQGGCGEMTPCWWYVTGGGTMEIPLFKKLNLESPKDSAILPKYILQKKTCSHKNVNTNVHSHITCNPKWNPTVHQLMDKWSVVGIYPYNGLLFQKRTWVNFRNLKWEDGKTMYCMLPFICNVQYR